MALAHPGRQHLQAAGPGLPAALAGETHGP